VSVVDVGEAEGLRQVSGGPPLQRLPAELGRVVAGHHEDRRLHADLAKRLEQVQTVDPRQLDVEQDRVGVLLNDRGERQRRAAGDVHRVLSPEELLEDVLDDQVVVDHENAFVVEHGEGVGKRRAIGSSG